MEERPYKHPIVTINREITPIAEFRAGHPMVRQVQLDLADTLRQDQQKERLSILTRVTGPIPSGPRGLELAVLRRVRDLLTAQIESIQSP
jgi:hypothetical protein